MDVWRGILDENQWFAGKINDQIFLIGMAEDQIQVKMVICLGQEIFKQTMHPNAQPFV